MDNSTILWNIEMVESLVKAIEADDRAAYLPGVDSIGEMLEVQDGAFKRNHARFCVILELLPEIMSGVKNQGFYTERLEMEAWDPADIELV